MLSLNLISIALLCVGVFGLILSLKPAISINKRTDHKGWQLLLFLIVLFILGYLAILYSYLFSKQSGMIQLLLSSIMAGGGIFVALVIKLSYLSIIKAHTLADEEYYNARHDALTGLPNRLLFMEHIEIMLAAEGEHYQPFAVLMADLDKFKEINDTLGHAAGDKLLIELGRRLQGHSCDSTIIARLGGDEFAIILINDNHKSIFQTSRCLAELVSQPYETDGYSLVVDLSIGISMYPEHGQDRETLLKQADIAMYLAKESKQGIMFYSRELDTSSLKKLERLSDVRQAFALQQFELYYQPLIGVKDKSLCAFEALIRWPQKDGSVIMPDEFIPLIEESQFMTEVTRWAVKQVIVQIKRWQEINSSIRISVNLSSVDLQDVDLANYIEQCLKDNNVDAQHLCLELTESSIMADRNQALAIIHNFKDLGACIAFDDFGTGYSSLSLLKDFPVTSIKIDRTFIKDLVSCDADYAIVSSIIQLAHDTHRFVVAEGVEDLATCEELKKLGCDVLQGYYYAKPMSANEAESWCDNSYRLARACY